MSLLPLLKGVAIENPEIRTLDALESEMKLRSVRKRIRELVKTSQPHVSPKQGDWDYFTLHVDRPSSSRLDSRQVMIYSL